MNEKKIAKANCLAEFYYGLIPNKKYILERFRDGPLSTWSVYDFNGNYITECRTDCFDDYRDFEEKHIKE
jgi:hypothetical protein